MSQYYVNMTAGTESGGDQYQFLDVDFVKGVKAKDDVYSTPSLQWARRRRKQRQTATTGIVYRIKQDQPVSTNLDKQIFITKKSAQHCSPSISIIRTPGSRKKSSPDFLHQSPLSGYRKPYVMGRYSTCLVYLLAAGRMKNADI